MPEDSLPDDRSPGDSIEVHPSPPADARGNLRQSVLVIFQIILVVAIPSALTLRTVQMSVTPPPVADNPTPLGYTWSLLLFIVPLVYLAVWFLRHPHLRVQRKAFGYTLLVLVPLGFLLDFFFAHTFFVFENTGAVTGIDLPGVGGGIPIEEFAFYLTGFVFVLLLYIWADEYWLGLYNPDLRPAALRPEGLLRFHWESLATAALLLGAALLYKKVWSDVPEGFPWYWTYLLIASFVPSAGFLRAVAPRVNWRAFSFSLILVLLISLMWEASLASPYGWWGYQDDRMMGIFIDAWSGLPIEAVFVWLAVTFTTVIIYEVISICVQSPDSARTVLLGAGDTAG